METLDRASTAAKGWIENGKKIPENFIMICADNILIERIS
jgi:hypothetical protein